MYCVKKFNLNGNVISANTKLNIIYSALGNCFVYTLLFITLKNIKVTFDVPMVFYMHTIAYSQYALNYTILNSVNFRLSSYNVQLILKLQEIDRLLGNAKDTRKLKRVVWTSCVSLYLSYSLFVTMKVLTNPHWSWDRALFNFVSLIFDLELTYFTIVLLYLTHKFDRWIDALMTANKTISENEDTFRTDKMFLGYKALIDARLLIKTASQWTVDRYLVSDDMNTYSAILNNWLFSDFTTLHDYFRANDNLCADLDNVDEI